MKRINSFISSENCAKFKRNKVLQEEILDYNSEDVIKIDEFLVEKLKPHQIAGIRFMWESCFESGDKLTESIGGGCILAHCMGVGII